MKVYLHNHKTGDIKAIPVGFSWPTLFLGPVIPILRGHILLSVTYSIVFFLTLGAAWLYFPFIINRYTLAVALESGFTPSTFHDRILLQKLGIAHIPVPLLLEYKNDSDIKKAS